MRVNSDRDIHDVGSLVKVNSLVAIDVPAHACMRNIKSIRKFTHRGMGIIVIHSMAW